MKALYLQHYPTNSPGILAEPFSLDVLDATHSLPSSFADYKAVILGGGPQHVWDPATFYDLEAELDFIRSVHYSGVPLLGVCLGAQLMSAAFGGGVYARDEPEIGWLPVELTDAGARDPLFAGVARSFVPRQRHHDSFTLPPGATHLARSEACEQQGFRLKSSYAFQFHFEMTSQHQKNLVKETPGTGLTSHSLELDLAMIETLYPTASRIVEAFSELASGSHPD